MKLSRLFDRAPRTTRQALLAAASIDLVAAGAVLIEQHAAHDALIVLSRGRARVERSLPDGRQVVLGYRGPGDVVGESALGRPSLSTERVVAMEAIELVRLPIELARAVIASNADLAAPLFGLVLTRMRETEDRIGSLLSRNVEGRLVEFLLAAVASWGVPTPRGTLIAAPLTHLEIAQSIGSTRETVTLTLGALRREGLLEVAGRRIVVTDRDALAAR